MTDNPKSSTPQLSVESSLDLLLVLLYARGKTGEPAEPIDGVTRLQKLVFLLRQGHGPKDLVQLAREYGYEPYKMGPYSRQVNEDLDILTSLGLLRTRRLEYLLTDDSDDYDYAEAPTRVQSLRFELTTEGAQAGHELWESLSKKDREGLQTFKRFFNSLSLRQLLIFVYEKFPEFTSKSEIKNQIL